MSILRIDYLYNAGSELNESTNNYQTFFRDYDPALGRMVGVDIMANKYSSVSPYNYAFNDPIGLNDPSGACPACTDPNPTYNEQYFNATPIDGGLAGGSSIFWGNDGGQAAAMRRFLRGGGNNFISFLTDLTKGISTDGTYNFSSSATNTLFGVWSGLGNGEAVLWKMNDGNDGMNFFESQLLASVNNFIGDGFGVYEGLGGVSFVPDQNASVLPINLGERNLVFKNVVQGMRYLYKFNSGDLPAEDYDNLRDENGVSILSTSDLFDFSSATEDAGWEKGSYTGYPGFNFWGRGGDIEIGIQETTVGLGGVNFDMENRIRANETNGRYTIYIQFSGYAVDLGYYQRAKNFIKSGN